MKDRTRRIDGMRKVAEVAVNIKVEKLPKNFDLKQLGRCVVTPLLTGPGTHARQILHH